MKKRDGDAMSGGVLCMRCCSFSSCRGEWHVARCMYGVCMESPFRARSMHTIYHSMPMHDVNGVSICQSIRISLPHLFHISASTVQWRSRTMPRRPPGTRPPPPTYPRSTSRWTTTPPRSPPTCSPSCPACPPPRCTSSTSPPPSSTSTAMHVCVNPRCAVSRGSSTASATTGCRRGSTPSRARAASA